MGKTTKKTKKKKAPAFTELKIYKHEITGLLIGIFVLMAAVLVEAFYYCIPNGAFFWILVGFILSAITTLLAFRQYHIPKYNKLFQKYEDLTWEIEDDEKYKNEIADKEDQIQKLTQEKLQLGTDLGDKRDEVKRLKKMLTKYQDMIMLLYIPDFGMNPEYEMDERTFKFVKKIYDTFNNIDPELLDVFDTYSYYSNDIYRFILDNHSEEYLSELMYEKSMDKKMNDSYMSGTRNKLIDIQDDIIKRYKDIRSSNFTSGKKGGSSGAKFTDHVGTRQYLDIKTLLEEVNDTEEKTKERELEKPEKSYDEEER